MRFVKWQFSRTMCYRISILFPLSWHTKCYPNAITFWNCSFWFENLTFFVHNKLKGIDMLWTSKIESFGYEIDEIWSLKFKKRLLDKSTSNVIDHWTFNFVSNRLRHFFKFRNLLATKLILVFFNFLILYLINQEAIRWSIIHTIKYSNTYYTLFKI